eukprot:m.130187 g.130187  ORF g.130187 m.130187 type:complete len:74 (-) comp15714_c2_seq11:1612-1833(-)
MDRATKLLQQLTVGADLTRKDEDVVIICGKRTPLCKARKGGFKDTPSSDLLETGGASTSEHIFLSPLLQQASI